MAAQARHRKLHDARRLLVAGIAGKGLMSAVQREPGHRVVVEAVLLPVAAIMAVRAIGAVAALVDVILHMAGEARPRRLPDGIADAVAGGAARCSMLPDQGKAGVGVVIEGRRLPANWRVTACAVGSACSFVDVVPGVAGDALGWGAAPALACMAGQAGRSPVSACQRKAG